MAFFHPDPALPIPLLPSLPPPRQFNCAVIKPKVVFLPSPSSSLSATTPNQREKVHPKIEHVNRGENCLETQVVGLRFSLIKTFACAHKMFLSKATLFPLPNTRPRLQNGLRREKSAFDMCFENCPTSCTETHTRLKEVRFKNGKRG